MINNMTKSERERRAEALSKLGGDVEGEPREVAGRDIKQMLSVRIEGGLVAELRQIAQSRGVKVSDLLREAAAKLASDYKTPTLQIRSLTVTQSASLEPTITMNGNASIEGQRGVCFSSGNRVSQAGSQN